MLSAMPSPLGHALAAAAVGLAVLPPRERAAVLRSGAAFAAIGMAPDLDLLIGRHSAETHSIGAAFLVASFAAWRPAWFGTGRLRVWLAVLLAYLSHPVLDALSLDTSPPLGVMLFWPFDAGYYQTGWSVFGAISRRYWLPEFVTYNVWAVARELVVLGPLTWLAARRARVASPRAQKD